MAENNNALMELIQNQSAMMTQAMQGLQFLMERIARAEVPPQGGVPQGANKESQNG